MFCLLCQRTVTSTNGKCPQCGAPLSPSIDLTGDDYLALRAVIPAENSVVAHLTHAESVGKNNLYELPGVASHLFKSFDKANHQPAELGHEIERPLVDTAELFSDGREEGWREFHLRYPDCCLYHVSRVGFNPLKTFGLVTVSQYVNSLVGHSTLFLLEKSGATWVVGGRSNLGVS
jgi:hypothetical protein